MHKTIVVEHQPMVQCSFGLKIRPIADVILHLECYDRVNKRE